MAESSLHPLTDVQLGELCDLLGPPSVVGKETERYTRIWQTIIACLKPQDFIEFLLVETVQHETWWILFYQRHRAVSINRRLSENTEFQRKRQQAQRERFEAAAREVIEKMKRPPNEFDQLVGFEHVIAGAVTEVDEILQRGATDHDYNRTLEQSLGILHCYDKLTMSATRRRSQALELLEHYRAGLGSYLRRITDVIDAAVNEGSELLLKVESPPLADVDQVSLDASKSEVPSGPASEISPTDAAVTEGSAAASESCPKTETPPITETTEEEDPLDRTRHYSYRTDVLRKKARGEPI